MANQPSLIDALDLDQYPLGTRHHLRFRVADFPDGSPLTIPLTLLIGRRRQPKVVAVAGVHGDEFEGPRALMALARELVPVDLNGVVVLVPISNPLAYNARSREAPEDGLNLNRIFPGHPNGTLSQRIAHTLVRGIIAPCDLAIDLHSADRWGLMVPMSGFRDGHGEIAFRSAKAAAAFGLEMYWRMAWAPGTLSTALNQLEIPAVGCEVGGMGVARRENVELYHEGVIRCLRMIGIVDPPLNVEIPSTVRTMEDVTSAWSGLLDLAVSLGQQVEPKQLIARVLNAWGEEIGKITAPFAGMVAHQRLFRQVRTGETVVSLAREVENHLRSGSDAEWPLVE